MSECPESRRLLSLIAGRLRLISLGRMVFLISAGAASAYFVLFLISRLTGLIPDWFHPASVAAIPVTGLLLALLLHHRPQLLEAARRVDQTEGTKDLFLTLTLLDRAPGEYQPLVSLDAEERARKIVPERVVPFLWERRVATVCAALAMLAMAVVLVPQLDPFGKVEAAQQVESLRRELTETRQDTAARRAELQKDKEDDLSEEVQKTIDQLVEALKQMKRDQKEDNARKLAEQQKEIGAEWRSLRNSNELKELLNKDSLAQNFGRTQELMRKWGEELENGRPEALEKKVEDLKDKLERLQKETDPAKRQELQQEIKREMKELQDFAREKVKSGQLQASLQRAMKQMESGQTDPKLLSEAMEAAQESLDLAKMELKEIAQSARDLKALEESLKAIQAAKKLNEAGQLDGESGEGQGLEDYAEMYAEMMAEMGEGQGEGDGQGQGDGDGTGGEGMGRGGKTPEDESISTDFQKEKSKSATKAGKVLLSMKTKGLSESGDAKADFQRLASEVRQGLSEAIELEQIPPGYVPGIKSYFDTLEQSLQAEPPAEATGRESQKD